MSRLISACVIFAALAAPAAAAPSETAQERDRRLAWWREARFGMFIHWGLYAVPAGEWKGQRTEKIGEWIMKNLRIPIADYETLVPQFNPVKFDAREWVRIAKDAGMKYIVITSKHHDGFALFDSKVSSYDVMASPFKRDILKELSDASARPASSWASTTRSWTGTIPTRRRPPSRTTRRSATPTGRATWSRT